MGTDWRVSIMAPLPPMRRELMRAFRAALGVFLCLVVIPQAVCDDVDFAVKVRERRVIRESKDIPVGHDVPAAIAIHLIDRRFSTYGIGGYSSNAALKVDSR